MVSGYGVCGYALTRAAIACCLPPVVGELMVNLIYLLISLVTTANTYNDKNTELFLVTR
jgi:hypothetical protein